MAPAVTRPGRTAGCRAPVVAGAWQQWNALLALPGPRSVSSATALATAVGSLPPSPGGCSLSHGTLVDQGFPASAGYGSDYGFFPFPEVSGRSSSVSA